MTDAQLNAVRREVEALEVEPGYGTVEIIIKDNRTLDVVVTKRIRIS